MSMMIDTLENKRDLLLNVIKNPDKNFEDLVNAGFTIDNIEFHSKDVYQNDSEIQQTFSKNGEFDQALFDKVYDTVSYYKDGLLQIKDSKQQIDFFTYHRDNFLADESKRRKGPDFTIFKAPNPFEQTSSIILLGKLEKPTKTAAEIAQGEQVHNLKTDTWEESPEESSLFGNIFDEAKVLAVYEEDGVHEDPITGEMVLHKVGDLKFNANGKPYYETLNGRDVYGRLVLSNFDVLTSEDSDWNRYDFFDNDGYDKSVVGNIAKTVAVVAPMFIPYVGPVYTGASVLVNAAGLFGTLGKIANIDDWMNEDTAKFFNNIEGWSKSMNTLDSRSEYAKQHMWSIENIIGLAGDVISQLKEQRWIFQYGPVFFNPNWNATKALTAKKGIDLEQLTKNFLKKLQKSKFAELVTDVSSKSKNPIMDAATVLQGEAKRLAESYFSKSLKISEVLSKLYMTGITTLDGYSEAKAAGADDATAAIYALVYAAGEYAIINSNIGEWILPEKKIGAELNRKALNTIFSSLSKSKPAATATKSEKLNWIQNVAKEAKKKLSSDYIVGAKNQSQTIMDNMLAGALSESIEEVSEELWTDLSRSLYNTVLYFRGEEDASMKAWDNVLDRYLMSAVGGALGGGVTALDLDVVNLLNKDMQFNEATQRVITMIRNNDKNHEFDNLLKTASKMNFGTVKLENGKTGNEIVQSSLRQFSNFVNQVINAENANLSDDHILNKVSKELREDFKWSQLMSPFYKEEVGEDGRTKLTPIENSIIGAKILLDINSDLAVILGDAASNYLAENDKTDAQERKEEKQEPLKKKEEEKSNDPSKVDKARKHLQDTLSGALNYEYAQLFLYEYTHMGEKLIPSTFRAFVKMKTGKHLEEFDEELKKDLKEKYDATKKNRADLLMFLANVHQQISELSKETVEKNAQIYEQNAKNEKLKHLTKFLEKIVSFDDANVDDDKFLETFSTLYNELELRDAELYTEDGEKALDENGNVRTRKLGLYTALNSSFGEEEDWQGGIELFKVDEIKEEDSPELKEKKKQLLDYNELFKKYYLFIGAIKLLGRLVEYYEKLGFINSELKLTLYHLTDKLNKNRTKIELLSNRYSDILKNISKLYFTLEESEASFYTFINSLFPGKTFTSPEEFKTYIETEAKDTPIGSTILGLMSEGLELDNNADLTETFLILTNALSAFEGVLNYDKIANRDYVDQALLGFNENFDGTQREEIYNKQIERIEQLQTDLQETLNLTELTRTKLNNLAHTQMEEDLNKFAISIGEEAIFTNLMEALNLHLFLNRNSIDSVMLNDALDKRIDDALWLIDRYEDTLNTARTVLYDATDVWGYNRTLNSIAKKVKSEKELPTLAEISSETADVFLQDLGLYKKKLKFIKKLYSVNAGQKFATNDRVELNTSYIFLSRLKKWIGSFEPKDGFEGVEELSKALDELTMVDKFYNKGEKNYSLSLEEKVLMTKERIKAEVALHEFFKKNLETMSYDKFKKLLVPKDFTISDLFRSRPTIINEKTQDVSFLEFINYLATRAAVNANDLRYEVAGVILDEIKSDSVNKIVPIPTQVEAVFYPYAKFANPKVILKFTDFKRKLLEESVNNITKELLIELNDLGLAPFGKGALDSSNVDEALTKFKENLQSLLAYPEFEDVITLVEGMPGTGKSFGVDDLIAKMLAKYHKEYLEGAIVINTTSETAEKLAKALKLKNSYTIEEFLTQTMQNHKEVAVNAEGNLEAKEGVHYKVVNESQIDAIAEPKEGLKLPQIIFVDELPTLNRILILELAKLARKYNIEILATGDYNQTTPSGRIEIKKDGESNFRSLKVSRSKYFPSTKLGVSMRTDNNQKTNNINLALVAVDTAQYEPDEDVDLTLTYMEDENGIFGDKVVFAQNEDITDEQLSQILKDVDLMIKTLKKDKKGEFLKINYIFSNPNSKLYKKLSQDNKYKNYILFHAGNTSQGKEGQYWIVENNRNVSSLSTYMQELYTGISRSEQGSIIIASSNYSGNLAKLTLKNTRTTVRINEGLSESIKQAQLEKLIKFYGALKLDEHPVDIVRNKPVSLKNPLIEELRKAERDASLSGEPIYYSIKQEDPLIIKVGDEEISITKEDLINKIKTENYRLKEKEVLKDEEPNILKKEVIDEKSNRKLADSLNDKRRASEKRIEPLEESLVINYYRYLYSAFSMETSVELDDSGNLVMGPDSTKLSTDPLDKRIDNIIGLYKHFNGKLDYYTLHQKLNALRIAFLTIDNLEKLNEQIYDILEIPEDLKKDLYVVFGYKKTNATLKESGDREEQAIYGKANKTDKETIEYNALGGERSNEVGVNNLVVNIGYDSTGDFLEIPLMRFASPISIMYLTDTNGNYLFPKLIEVWEESKETTTFGKMKELIKKFGNEKKYEYIINEFKFYTLPNSNYFSISALDSDWLPARNLQNLGPQVVTSSGIEFYNEAGFEFNNDDPNSWQPISAFRESYRDIMQVSRVKMFTSNIIAGVDISNHVDIGFPFVLTKLGQAYDSVEETDERLMQEFLKDIKEGNQTKIRVVYLSKPKISLNSYLNKVHNFIFKGGKKQNEHNEFGNIFTTFKILDALFSNFDENVKNGLINQHAVRTKVVKRLLEKVLGIKTNKSEPYTKEEIELIVSILKETFIAEGREEMAFDEGSVISVKTLFDSYVANLIKDAKDNSKIDESKLNLLALQVIAANSSLEYIYADGIKFSSVDGIVTLEDSYLLMGEENTLNPEEFFIHAKVTLPMFFNSGMDFVLKFMNLDPDKGDVFIRGKQTQYSKHNYNYFGVKYDKSAKTVVENPKYKYGKSKIDSENKPGEKEIVLTVDDLLNFINEFYDQFNNSKKTATDAKSLFGKVNLVIKKIKELDPSFDTDSILINTFVSMLNNGIYIIQDKSTDIPFFYNLKTKDFLKTYGLFQSIRLDEDTKQVIITFKLGDKLYDYVVQDATATSLTLMNITPEQEVNETEGLPLGATEGEAGTNLELEKLLKYIQEFDSIFSDPDFSKILLEYAHIPIVKNLRAKIFNPLGFENFNESLYQLIQSQSPTEEIKIARFNNIKKALNAIIVKLKEDNDTLAFLLEQKIKVIDNFINPPSC